MNATTLSSINFKSLIIAIAMLVTAGLAIVMTPKQMVADQGPTIDLEAMIPKQFGDWELDASIVPLLADPTQTALLDKIYNQTLSRTYANGKGERVMLSIAYGSNQSDSMALHKPEVCYPSQGFEMQSNKRGTISTVEGDIPVKRLVAVQGRRIEPITYWTTVGDTLVLSGIMKKINQMKYGFTGRIPDGLLFRISSIQADENAAYRAQDDFTRALLGALTPESKQRIIGKLRPST